MNFERMLCELREQFVVRTSYGSEICDRISKLFPASIIFSREFAYATLRFLVF